MYYRLTYITSENKEVRGDYVLNGTRPLNIGQGEACDVRLPDSDLYEPALFATILSYDDGEGWYIVRRTDHCPVLVNGQEVPIACPLNDKDVLAFTSEAGNTELRFDIFDDGEYDAKSGLLYRRHNSRQHLLFLVAFLAVLAVGAIAYAVLLQQKDLRHFDLSEVKQSVYHITTDSVCLMCDTVVDGRKQQVVVEAIELAQVAAGTCFLTTDGLFVTARHCIEPWLNDEEWDGVSVRQKMSPELRLATIAETRNRLAGNKKYTVRAHCVISKGLDRYDYYSTDFSMNMSRDKVMRLGSAKEVIYWRTIFPIAHRRDMELGDFAYLKADGVKEKGSIQMATIEDLQRFSSPGSDHDIAVVGYPLNDNDADDVAVSVFGNLMSMEFEDDGNGPQPVGCMQLSALINRGNSGGPVFAMINGELKVVGIVSKADGRADQGMFWAVPVTEVLQMHGQGDKVDESLMMFRR